MEPTKPLQKQSAQSIATLKPFAAPASDPDLGGLKKPT